MFAANLRLIDAKPVILVLMLGAASCAESSPVGTPEDRQALFDYLVEKTAERESFSPVKNERLAFDVESSMRQYEDEVVRADTEQALFYALAKVSHARHDRHLDVWEIEGGLKAPPYYPGTGQTPPIAPIRVEFDYAEPGDVVLFVIDVSADSGLNGGIEPGDRIVTVNGQPVADRVRDARPYFRFSTVLGYRKKFAENFATRTGALPPAFYRDELVLTLERAPGEIFEARLPYLAPDGVEWSGTMGPVYPGFKLAADRDTFDLYLSTEGRDVLIIDWHGFNQSLVDDMDWLMQYAAENALLDHDIVWDGTNSGGGSRGAYAVRRLSPQPFKTTFGNLRISDVIPEFIERKSREYEQQRVLDGGVSETMDDGAWLIDWLTDDVQKAFDAGQAYTNNVPFKLAHAPKWSDGVLHPADVHFRGDMVCLFGPHGGSHLDQFAAIVVDNGLCHTIGMPTGGYSNTWEWEEEVVFPGSEQPVIGFMWSIGHTISPAGRIVEGRPAEIDEHIPLTRENFAGYKAVLLDRALDRLAAR